MFLASSGPQDYVEILAEAVAILRFHPPPRVAAAAEVAGDPPAMEHPRAG